MKWAAIVLLLACAPAAALANCLLIDVDGNSHLVCDNSPPPSADYSFGGAGILEGLQILQQRQQQQAAQEQLQLQAEEQAAQEQGEQQHLQNEQKQLQIERDQLQTERDQLELQREQAAQQGRDGGRLVYCDGMMAMSVTLLQANLQNLKDPQPDPTQSADDIVAGVINSLGTEDPEHKPDPAAQAHIDATQQLLQTLQPIEDKLRPLVRQTPLDQRKAGFQRMADEAQRDITGTGPSDPVKLQAWFHDVSQCMGDYGAD